MKKHMLFLTAAVLMLAGCAAQQDSLVGSWVQPVPGMQDQVQGIQIDEGGKASSINMATLVYTGWRRDGADSLVLSGQSIGNGQTIDFAETMTVKSLTPDELVLADSNGTETVYTRQN